jgi:hypothetical protein
MEGTLAPLYPFFHGASIVCNRMSVWGGFCPLFHQKGDENPVPRTCQNSAEYNNGEYEAMGKYQLRPEDIHASCTISPAASWATHESSLWMKRVANYGSIFNIPTLVDWLSSVICNSLDGYACDGDQR